MISEQTRQNVFRLITEQRVYKLARDKYTAKTGRPIHWAYLYKFISGQRKCKGTRPGSHQPLQMLEAIVDAIAQVKQEQKNEAGKIEAAASQIVARLAA